MAILLTEKSRIAIQGITGRVGQIFVEEMVKLYPGVVVAGVTPGRGGSSVQGLPVYDSVAEAVTAHGVDACLICVPPTAFREAALEAIESGVKVISAYPEGVPLHDTIFVARYARACNAVLIGPNSAGVLSPGKAGAGELTEGYFPARPGNVGIVSKSGSIAYEVSHLTSADSGQSTIVCLGGDPFVGTKYTDILPLFDDDPETKVVVLLGEIGGGDEYEAAARIAKMSKPVIAYVSGHSAPPGKKMGHAGALVLSPEDSAAAKSEALRAAGADVVRTLPEIPARIQRALASRH